MGYFFYQFLLVRSVCLSVCVCLNDLLIGLCLSKRFVRGGMPPVLARSWQFVNQFVFVSLSELSAIPRSNQLLTPAGLISASFDF